jgi:CheY-like chemotaxis protein
MGESARAAKLKGLRVLVVEDEALVAFQLEDMLAELGCAVIGPASRVGQALDLLGRERVDAAVLDVNVAGELVYPVADALTAQGPPLHLRHRLRRCGPDAPLPLPTDLAQAVPTERPAPAMLDSLMVAS